MRAKSMMLAILSAAMFAGCSDGKDDSDLPDNSMIGRAFLSLSLQSSTGPSSKADITTQPGSSAESKADDVRVLLFNEHDVCLDVVTITGATIGNSGGNGTPTAAATEAQVVPAKTKKVFVVINPYTGSSWNFAVEAVKGKTWTEINTAIDATIANVATDNNFMMASEGDKTDTNKGALTEVTVHKPTDYTQAKVDEAKAAAKAAPAVVNVDRLACKVTVTMAENATFTKPQNTSFTFSGWELSVTNKSVRLYSDLVDYPNKTTGAVYRKDNNYTEAELNTINTNTSTLRAAFDYLENIDTDAQTMPAVSKASATNAYCLENTMEAKAQKLGFTTKVVIKAKYTPKDITANTSYFSWGGKFYTLDALKTEYTNTPSGGLKTDLPIFLHKAGLMADGVFNGTDQTAKDNVVTALTAASFNEKTGIIGRFCAVRYYHESVCYYDVLIRHDKNITQKMALGRYGVVRNNWYAISLQSVTGPGTPWIPDPSDPGPTPTPPGPTDPAPAPDPDDPHNPTPPGVDDDENDAYLSVEITINPWTYWTQEAELH